MERRDWGAVRGYELVSRLGRGSHGEVYRALQSSTGQLVAVKILQIRTNQGAPSLASQTERFRREMLACAALRHPNIVRAIDAGTTEDGRLYSVFEYVPGPTLRAVLQEHRALPLPRLRELLLQTLDALVCAHESGIVHRDFKPENIVVSSTGLRPHFKVLDFGISAFVDGSSFADSVRLTGTGETVGTPAYAAPEQLRGDAPSPRSDLYAWGLVALECLTGRPAVQGLSLAEVHYLQLLPQEIALPAELSRHPLGELLRWVLVKSPERRASNAGAVYARLQALAFSELGNAAGYLESAPSSAPPPLASESDAAHLSPLGERRLLTALCLRFALPAAESGVVHTGFRSDTLDGLLHEQRRRCQLALESAGGQLVSFVGSRAVGLFGFPKSHEQDARRAAQCAIDLHQSVALQSHALSGRVNLKLELSGGLHTGLVELRGDEGTADRVAGLVLAEASDLADAAGPGEILVSAASELPARRDLEFEAAGEVVLATSGTKVSVYRLLGARDRFALPSSPGCLLGRESELSRLEEQQQKAALGTGRRVWIEGEAGVGKSALLQHFRAALAASGCQYALARGLAETRQVALQPILELLRLQLGLTEREPSLAVAQLKEQLARHGFDAGAMAPLLCPWFQLPLDDARPPPFAPQRMRELAIDAMARIVLRLLGDGPAAFVLEDAHWCDASTREWLDAFRQLSQHHPVLLVLTSRPGAQPQIKAACAPHEEIVLHGLADADAAALIVELAGDRTLEPQLVEAMVQHADGVPLFLQELTRFVQSHRIVSGRALEIPNSLRELLGARLDQLGPSKITAQVAAVIGREFDLRLLQHVSSRDSATLLGDVEQLISAGLVEMQRRIAQPRYRFRHALIRATAYDTLLPSSRETLHSRVAEVLETNFPDLVRTEPQVMAHHWSAAGAEERALSYAKRASMDLLMRSSHLELVEHSQLALSWLKNIPEAQAQIYHELDLTLPYLLASMSVRGYAEASISAIVERAEQLLEQAPEYAGSFNLLFAMGLFYHVQGLDRARALRTAERLTELAESRPQFREFSVFAWCGLVSCHYADGHLALGEKFADRVCTAYQRDFHGPMAWRFGFDVWIAAVSTRVLMHWILGHLDRCHHGLSELEKYAKELGHPESLAQVLFTVCVIGHCRRDREQLARGCNALNRLADEHRLHIYTTFCRLFAALIVGDSTTALGATTQLGAAGHVGGSSYQQSVLAEIELANGDVVSANHRVQQGIAHAEMSGERFWLPRLLCQRALLSRRLGQPRNVSAADLDSAIAEANHRGMLMFELEAQVLYSTLSSAQPSMDWEGAALPLSRAAVSEALEGLRSANTDQQLAEATRASAE